MPNPTPDTGTLPGTALETYGHLLQGDVGRDAIHLAVYAVTTDERLFPGQHVGIVSFGDDGIKVSAKAEKLIGIVDPFLDTGVFPGGWFWLTLYPRTITSLRHEWTHPAFDVTVQATPAVRDPKIASEAWLRNYADEIDETFNTLMEAAKDWVERGDWFYGAERHGYHGKFEGVSTHPDFWQHYQVYTGTVVDPDKQIIATGALYEGHIKRGTWTQYPGGRFDYQYDDPAGTHGVWMQAGRNFDFTTLVKVFDALKVAPYEGEPVHA